MRSLLTTILFSVSVAANAVTVDFDGSIVYGPAPSSSGLPESVTTQGYYFYSDAGFLGGPNDGPDGSQSFAYCPGCTADMTTVSGQSFSLHSVDLKNNEPLIGDDFLSITGTLLGGGTVSANLAVSSSWDTFTFDSSWSNLVSVEFGATVGGGFNAIFIDNVVVTAVPIPAAVWLFGSALAGLGWMRRKQTA